MAKNKNETLNKKDYELKSFTYTIYGTEHKTPDFIKNAKDKFLKEDFSNYFFDKKDF